MTEMQQILAAVMELKQGMEKGFSEVNERFDRIEERLGNVETSVEKGFISASKQFDKMDRKLNQIDRKLDDNTIEARSHAKHLTETVKEHRAVIEISQKN